MVISVELGLIGDKSVTMNVTSLGASWHRILGQAREWVQMQTGFREKRCSLSPFLQSFLSPGVTSQRCIQAEHCTRLWICLASEGPVK